MAFIQSIRPKSRNLERTTTAEMRFHLENLGSFVKIAFILGRRSGRRGCVQHSAKGLTERACELNRLVICGDRDSACTSFRTRMGRVRYAVWRLISIYGRRDVRRADRLRCGG